MTLVQKFFHIHEIVVIKVRTLLQFVLFCFVCISCFYFLFLFVFFCLLLFVLIYVIVAMVTLFEVLL